MRVGGAAWVQPVELLPARAPRRHEEDDLQRAIVQYLDRALPSEGIVFAIPNGGKRSKTQAARMKGLGVKAGVGDLCVVYRGRAFFIEVKTQRGVLSVVQRNMLNKLQYCGAPVCCCRSVEEVEAALREACIPLRASVAA